MAKSAAACGSSQRALILVNRVISNLLPSRSSWAISASLLILEAVALDTILMIPVEYRQFVIPDSDEMIPRVGMFVNVQTNDDVTFLCLHH